MAKRKSKPIVSPFFDGVKTKVEVRPEDAPFLRLVDALSAFASYDPEKEYQQRIAEGERQLEIVAQQVLAQQEKELARRAECRRLRLEREKAEKLAAGVKSGGKSGRQPGNRVRKAG